MCINFRLSKIYSFSQKFLLVKRLFASAPLMQRPNVVFILGPPGSGKGTQCALLSKKFGFVHLSAGELLRQEMADAGSQYKTLIDTEIREGRIVPARITINLLEQAMQQNGWAESTFLIDGFPRNLDNLTSWQEIMGEKVHLKAVLFYECTENVCSSRIAVRSSVCNRSDDNIESLAKRFNTYISSTLPIIKHFEQEKLLIKVNAEPSPTNVFDFTVDKIRNIL